MAILTEAELQMVNCIGELTEEYGFPPTVREIQSALGYRSTSSVHYHIKRLAAARVISYEPAKRRTVVVLTRQNPDKNPTKSR